MPVGLVERTLLDALAVIEYVADHGASTTQHLAKKLDMVPQNLRYIVNTILAPCLRIPTSMLGTIMFVWLDPRHINHNDETIRLLRHAVDTAVKLSREYRSSIFSVKPEQLLRGNSDRRMPKYASALLELLRPYVVSTINYSNKKGRRLVLPTNLNISFEEVLSDALQRTAKQFTGCGRHVYYKLNSIGYADRILSKVCNRNRSVCEALLTDLFPVLKDATFAR